jgi:hypothetical protein
MCEEPAVADVLLPGCREAALRGLTTPEDFVVKEGALSYADGSSYKASLWRGAPSRLPLSPAAHQLCTPDTSPLGTALLQGDLLGSLRHGEGTYTLPSGAVYSGSWRYDSLQGRGTAVMPDGQTYEGEWRAGKAEGCAAPVARSWGPY